MCVWYDSANLRLTIIGALLMSETPPAWYLWEGLASLWKLLNGCRADNQTARCESVYRALLRRCWKLEVTTSQSRFSAFVSISPAASLAYGLLPFRLPFKTKSFLKFSVPERVAQTLHYSNFLSYLQHIMWVMRKVLWDCSDCLSERRMWAMRALQQFQYLSVRVCAWSASPW